MFSYVPNIHISAANDDRAPRERTVPIPESITAVIGYPSKLVVFKIAASRFWQVRCWMDGRTYRRSTKCTSLKLAQRFARCFYEELVANKFSTHISSPRDIQGKTDNKSQLTFGAIAAQVYANEESRVARGEFGAGSLRMFRNRLDSKVLPTFGQLLPIDIDYKKLLEFSQSLSSKYSTTTVSHYLIVVRKVLVHAQRTGIIESVPDIPKIKVRSASRGAFTPTEYWQIIRKARELRGKPHPLSNQVLRKLNKLRYLDNKMPPDMAWAIGLMVNGFIRPGDLKKIKHRHIEVVRGSTNTYLRLTLPETKLHGAPIVTLYPAVRIYKQICKYQASRKLAKPNDFLFLPELKDRNYALAVLSLMFNWVLAETGLKLNPNGHPRSLYSLRHSAITFRLLYGQGIDLITLARNARTSVEVINKHYASTVTGEQNIAMLQSRRTQI
jgi:hypothetical protein